jgi:hypothetical protein
MRLSTRRNTPEGHRHFLSIVYIADQQRTPAVNAPLPRGVCASAPGDAMWVAVVPSTVRLSEDTARGQSLKSGTTSIRPPAAWCCSAPHCRRNHSQPFVRSPTGSSDAEGKYFDATTRRQSGNQRAPFNGLRRRWTSAKIFHGRRDEA